MMNCDQAFDCLTDAARRHSDELKQHLDLCPRCRQMQEVLSPAINLLVPPVDSGDYRSFSQIDESGLDLDNEPMFRPRPVLLSAESIRLAERTAAELARQSCNREQVRRRRFRSLSRFAALLLLGAVITFAVTAWSNRRERDRTTVSGIPSADKCLWVHHDKNKQPGSTQSSRQVVLSCVDCHLGQPFERTRNSGGTF